MLDFQISRYASPVTDLCYFIFCCTSGEFRQKYYEDILKVYYNSLSQLIKRYLVLPQRSLTIWSQIIPRYLVLLSDTISKYLVPFPDTVPSSASIPSFDRFKKMFCRLGSDPDKLFPHSAFQSHLKQFGFFGFLMALMVLPVFVAPSEEVPDMDEVSQKMADGALDAQAIEDMNTHSKHTQDAYAKRMRDTILDQVRLGMIDLKSQL